MLQADNPRKERLLLLALAAHFVVCPLGGQTTQGIISGRVYDRQTGDPIPQGTISCAHLGTGGLATAQTDQHGYYAVAFLSPGPCAESFCARSTKSRLN